MMTSRSLIALLLLAGLACDKAPQEDPKPAAKDKEDVGAGSIIDRLASKGSDLPDEEWTRLRDLTQKLADLFEEQTGRNSPVDVSSLFEKKKLKEVGAVKGIVNARFVLAGGDDVIFESRRGILVRSGNVSFKKAVSDSIFFVKGTFESRGHMSDCIVICDGDVRCNGKVNGSLIISTGRVRVGSDLSRSAVESRGLRVGRDCRSSFLFNVEAPEFGKSKSDTRIITESVFLEPLRTPALKKAGFDLDSGK